MTRFWTRVLIFALVVWAVRSAAVLGDQSTGGARTVGRVLTNDSPSRTIGDVLTKDSPRRTVGRTLTRRSESRTIGGGSDWFNSRVRKTGLRRHRRGTMLVLGGGGLSFR